MDKQQQQQKETTRALSIRREDLAKVHTGRVYLPTNVD